MAETSEQAKARVLSVLTELARGRDGALALACAPSVRWWLPTEPDWLVGPAAVSPALRAVLAGADVADPVAVAGSEDGSLVVVELRARSRTGGRTPVTSVVRLGDEGITSGRTYVDVAAVDRTTDEER